MSLELFNDGILYLIAERCPRSLSTALAGMLAGVLADSYFS